MKILFVVRTLGYGGAPKQLAMLANALAGYGHEVAIYSYNWIELQQPLREGVTFIPQKETQNSLVEYIRTPFLIRSQVKRLRPDVVISWRANAGCMTVVACAGLKVKTIFSERTDPYMETNWMLKIATKLAQLSDGGVFQTEKARDFYSRLAPRSIVVPNPINDNMELSPIVDYEKRPKKIAFVARVACVQKRHDILLEAFEKIHCALPDYTLSIYGDGPDFERLKQMVIDKGLSESVVLHGAVKNVIDHICTARLFLLTSDYEGIPNAILEAFMAGVPVVSTDCSPGGARVLIDDGENGYIVPMRDSEDLAERAIQVLQNSDIALRFIERSRNKLKDFSPKTIFAKWNEYVCEVVTQSS